ncbi:MAG: hypothetical protein ACYC3I_23230 [Gemmataceae bacterium]
MIIRFPDLDNLLLALTSGAVPADVAQKPAVAGFGENEQVWVETTTKLPAAARRELKRLGALVCKSSGVELSTEVLCWVELLPLVRDDAPLDALEKTSVLFDVPSGEELSRLVLEMLRLGNDRQSYRWLEETDGRAGSRPRSENSRALLRVIGPPYYSLLRAIDQLGGPEIAPHAFVERAPNVWVEVGTRHPLEAHIKPPEAKILLLRPPRQWLLLPDAPFRDIHEIVEFQLPSDSTRWQDRPLPHRLTVTPRLRQAGSADGAELWVLRGEAIDELNRFVQNAEDQLLGRLAFAIGEKNGQTIVVLRMRQSKLPPPVLVLPAETYKSHLKLPNLFLPAGYSLHPPLRRDVVRRLLAEDVSQITWLVPGENGQFIPEGLPDDVFRPLTDWVDYVLDRDREQLHAWVQAMQFEFEPFLCDEDKPSKPKKPPDAEKTRGPKTAPSRRNAEEQTGAKMVIETQAESGREDLALEEFAALEKAEPSEIEKELHAVEEEFLSLPDGLDDESRRALWPRLADLNARLKRTEDAGICWLNALWETDDTGKWAACWFRSEIHSGDRPWLAKAASSPGGGVTGDDLDSLLALPDPAMSALRALAAYLTVSAQREPRPPALMQRLPEIQRFLEKHEKSLPVRACWLAWFHLVQLTDGDVLALARARDRLLERLFHNGLRPEQDLPSFLRFAVQPNSQRNREVREWLKILGDKARGWIEDNRDILDRKPPTNAYADLLIAFGLARLSETDDAKRLLQRARDVLSGENHVHRFLLTAFEDRIRNVLDGRPHTGPLPRALLEELEYMDMLDRYVIERVRHNSRILEPDRQVDPYRRYAARLSYLDNALIELTDLRERDEIQGRILTLLRETAKGSEGHEARAKIVKAGLELGPHVGEEFARKMLDQALPVFNALPEPADDSVLEERARFLEKALFTAAHFGSTEHVRPLVARFRAMLQARRGPQAIDSAATLAEQSFRSLRKLGMRDEIDWLLRELADLVLQGRNIDAMAHSFNAKRDSLSPLIALLHVAGSWYYFGRDQLAEPVVKAARAILFGGELTQAKQRRDLACAYARTVGQATPTVALARLEEIFTHLKNYRDTFTTSSHFSVVQMDLIEAVILAVASEDFMQGTQARRWLDEDEYLVRQRIHADVKKFDRGLHG